jgi:hypothetical protein
MCLLKQQSLITIYRLYQAKRISVYRFHLQQRNRSVPFLFSACGNPTEVAIFHQFLFLCLYIYICFSFNIYTVYCIYIWKTETVNFRIYIEKMELNIYAAISNGKRKPRQFSLICLPFARRANAGLSFASFVDEENTVKYRSYGFANGLNGLNGLARLCFSATHQFVTNNLMVRRP